MSFTFIHLIKGVQCFTASSKTTSSCSFCCSARSSFGIESNHNGLTGNFSFLNKIKITEQLNLLVVGLHVTKVYERYSNKVYCFTIVILQLLMLHSHKQIHYLIAMHPENHCEYLQISFAFKTNAHAYHNTIVHRGCQNQQRKFLVAALISC